MSDRKSVVLGDTLHFDFNTRQADGTPITLAGNPSLKVYVEGSTTEITDGLTLTVDLDSVTGLHHVAAVLSTGNGYSVGDQGSIVLAAGTVDSISVVGTVLADFEVIPSVNVSANGNVGSNIKEIDDDTSAAANMESDYDGTGYAKSNSSIGATGQVSSGVTLVDEAITAAKLAADAITAIQNGLSTLDAAGVRTAIGLASADMDTQLAAIQMTADAVETDTQDIQSRLPATLVGGRMDSSVGAYQSGQAPLQPTTAGRTLDVSAGGEAGIDWANVGSPTTVVNLSGTTVKTATDVEADTQNIQSRLPSALTAGGKIPASIDEVKGTALGNSKPYDTV